MTHWITPRDTLPRDLTTIDVMKTVAIVLMIIDHVGWLLFPQIEWFRVFGRFCVPLWFFLIGYANSRDIPLRWMVAGIILLVSNLIVGLPPFALPILFTMALVRLCIDPFWRFVENNPVYFWWVILLLLFFSLVSDMVVEYGTMGFVLALTGYALRHSDKVGERLGYDLPEKLLAVALVTFGIFSLFKFAFSLPAAMVLVAGLIGIYFVLDSFVAKTLPNTADSPHAPLVRLTGRYTLEIYVIHLLILKAVFGLERLAAFLIG